MQGTSIGISMGVSEGGRRNLLLWIDGKAYVNDLRDLSESLLRGRIPKKHQLQRFFYKKMRIHCCNERYEHGNHIPAGSKEWDAVVKLPSCNGGGGEHF